MRVLNQITTTEKKMPKFNQEEFDKLILRGIQEKKLRQQSRKHN